MSYPNQHPPAPQFRPGHGLPPAPLRKDRSFIWAILIALAGWALFAIPALSLFFAAGFNLSLAPDEPNTAMYVTFCLASVACMIFSPVLLGWATTFRRRFLWILGIITVIPALIGAASIYLNPFF